MHLRKWWGKISIVLRRGTLEGEEEQCTFDKVAVVSKLADGDRCARAVALHHHTIGPALDAASLVLHVEEN